MSHDLNLFPIGNCAVAALIDARARFVWACVPRFDGDPAFCSLLSGVDPASPEASGLWAIDIEDHASTSQLYLRNTAVLSTRLTDQAGDTLEILDFCPRYTRHGRSYRPVAFARIVRPIVGAPRVRIRLRVGTDWGARTAATTSGSNHIRYLNSAFTLRLTTNAPVGYILEERPFRVERPLRFFLGPDEPFVGDLAQALPTMLEETVADWREWVRGLAIPFEWQAAVIRAAITLRLCQVEETGAIVAALTTSIPEAPNSGRNWDYRFCWLRDAYYTVQALNRLGALDVLENYLTYLRNVVDQTAGGHINPLYGVHLEDRLPERIEPNLPGYRGMGPVRVGNQAYEHLQHDVYGQIVLSNIQAFLDRRLLRPADEEDFAMLERVGERAFELHATPDAGIWEFRTIARVHTYSAVMCWAACDRLAVAAQALHLPERARHWRECAETVARRINTEAWNARAGHFAASFGGADLDASLLQLTEVRFINRRDPRFIATVEAVERALRRGPHMLRYAMPDDFGTPETAFNFCTFWLIEALHHIGRGEEASELFEGMLERLTPAGLLSEDSDLETGEPWGNYPQTYSLVGLINCAGLLSRPWSAAR